MGVADALNEYLRYAKAVGLYGAEVWDGSTAKARG